MPEILENKMPKKASRKAGARRSYAPKIAELEMYCRLMVDVLKKHPNFGAIDTAEGSKVQSSIDAYQDIMERLAK